MASNAKTYAIAASATGDNKLVDKPANAQRRWRVLAYHLSFSGAVNAKFRSGTNDLSGLLYGAAQVQAPSPVLPYQPVGGSQGLFLTNAGEDLNLNLSTNVAVGGWVTVEEVG